jgi:hypothetical protein
MLIRVTIWPLSFRLSHQNPVCITLLSMRATCHVHRIPIDLIILIILGAEYKLCSFLQPPVTSSLFGPNVLLNTLFSNTLSLRFSLNVRAQVLHPYKNINKYYIILR